MRNTTISLCLSKMMAPATVFNVSSSSKVLKFIQTHIDCMKCPQPKNTALRHQDHIHDEPPKHSTSAFQHYWTVHPFSPRNGPIDHTAGNLVCIPYCLTQEESSSPEWYFSCMCKTPKRQSGFLHHRKNYPWTPVQALWAHPPSLLLAEARVAIGLLGCACLSAYSL